MHLRFAPQLLLRCLPAICSDVIAVDCSPELCVMVKGGPAQLPEPDQEELEYEANLKKAEAAAAKGM